VLLIDDYLSTQKVCPQTIIYAPFQQHSVTLMDDTRADFADITSHD